MTSPFKSSAQEYYDAGLSPIPLGYPRGKPSKAATMMGWQSFARNRYTREKLAEMLDSQGGCNIGLVMGTIIQDGLQIVAVDIDNEKLMEDVLNALPSLSCGKKGNKGATYFFLADEKMTGRRIVNSEGTVVDFLSHKSQTVLPPSIHPDTCREYVWLTRSLLDINPRNLDVIHEDNLREIEEIARGSAEYFVGGHIDKLGDFPGLNEMIYLGDGKGGNTHDTILRSIAHMLATGWEDQNIVSRVVRAMKGAYARGGVEWDDPSWLTRQIEAQIEDGKKKGIKPSPKSKQQIPVERTWAEWLGTQMEYPTYYGSEVFSYQDGYYTKHITEQVSSLVVRSFNNATSDKAAAAFRTFCLLNYKPDFGALANDKICMRNGTLDISNKSLRNWSPEDELLYQMDVEWDPNSSCPKYEEFINWVFNGDEKAIAMFEEFAGLTFVDDMSFQRTLWLIGPGGNGKSTLVSLLTALHDPNVVSTVPISDINDERKLTSMVGKLINISTEQSRLSSITDTVFKQITGGDPVAVRRLFKEVDNNVKLKVRFLCLANEMPTTADSSEAMKRRMMILNCPNTLTEQQKDPLLGKKLLMEKQGIIRRWVEALNNLRGRGRFDISEASLKAVDNYLRSNDALESWLYERWTPSTEVRNEHSVLYQEFADWARMAGFKWVPRMTEFVDKLKVRKDIDVRVEKMGNARLTFVYGSFNPNDSTGRDF